MLSDLLTGIGTTSLGTQLGGKIGGAAAGASRRLQLEPETDPVKLTTFLCGGDISREGGKDPELKPESEYPDWLWTLRLERGSLPLDKLDPDTWDYWLKLQKINTRFRFTAMRMKYKHRRF